METLFPLAIGAFGKDGGAVGKLDNLKTRLVVPIEPLLDKVEVLRFNIGLCATINEFLDPIEMLSG